MGGEADSVSAPRSRKISRGSHSAMQKPIPAKGQDSQTDFDQ